MQNAGVEMLDVFGIEFRRRASEMREIEIGHAVVEMDPRLDRIGGAESGQQAVQGHRLQTRFALVPNRQRTEALGERFALRTGEERKMSVGRGRISQGLRDLDLNSCVGDMVFAANDMGDSHLAVVDDGGQRIERGPILPDQYRI